MFYPVNHNPPPLNTQKRLFQVPRVTRTCCDTFPLFAFHYPIVGECLDPKTGATHYYAQLGLPAKGRAIKELFVCNRWDLEPLYLLNSLALGC